jgi:transposase InsO family protein
MKYLFMKEHSLEFKVEKMAKVLRVYRSGYYKFLKGEVSQREIENRNLSEKIREVHKKNRKIYGSPRIHQELKKQGEKCSRKRVAKIMQKEKIQAKMRKKWVVTTQPSNTQERVAPNHLDQKFIVEEPNKVWVSDITYVATEEGWLYVAIVLDLFSRKIVGLSMGDSLHTDLVTKALKQALWHRNIKEELMHHSDRGCQYTSADFQELTKRHGIKLSMSAKGHCYDNAVAESFFHTLKTEHTNLCKYKIREEAKVSIFEHIEVFYNRQRMHSTLGYVSPEEFEQLWSKQCKCI